MINIDLSQVHHLAADLHSAEHRVVPAVQAEVARGAHRVEGLGKVNAPFEFGTLRSSITTDVDGLSYEVGPEANYGGYVEEGTSGPYPIDNAFGWDITVWHPGISPQPYMGPAFDRDLPRTERAILRAAADRTLG